MSHWYLITIGETSFALCPNCDHYLRYDIQRTPRHKRTYCPNSNYLPKWMNTCARCYVMNGVAFVAKHDYLERK